MDYDVLILGGGIIGCAVAYELSKYNLNIALIEKDYDIADDVALINPCVVYDGIECGTNLLSRLESMGNSIIREIAPKFNINFTRKGYLIVSDNEKDEQELIKIYDRALERGIKNIHILDQKQVSALEPNLNIKEKRAVYSKNVGIISPYDLAISYGEVAFDNGVNFKLEEEVLDIQFMSKGFKVVTNKNKFTCSMVLNTIPRNRYNIDNRINRERKVGYINYFLIENIRNKYHNILVRRGEKGQRIYIISVDNDSLMVEISTNSDIDYTEGLKIIEKYFGNIDKNKISIFYKSKYYNDDLIIDDSLIDKGYIKVIEKNWGQITMSPAIARIVCETIVNNLNCVPKKDFIDRRREFYRFKDMSNEERNQLIKLNKKYGKIVCYCQKVSEGEIIDSIRRPLGARTIEGIKRRTGATSGNCLGSQCLYKICSILARETNKNITDIVKDSRNSKIILSRIKEFDQI
ncbi:MAG: FAD-dependent oxidoreductase [Clostridium sp.]|jgi:L-2-hydroxyglutarate oxidase LhgO|uniref:NAD(P)/FAD-dependent oxidoreductase n=2 Tax=Clostridium sp. TaxID=1506 RepID=UPI0025C6224B|nr:FAD-dependent oxidoreductase [Clostridium sp.]MCH3965474.1 FAD-dependent oxidoreductase [Clostridium sp.]